MTCKASGGGIDKDSRHIVETIGCFNISCSPKPFSLEEQSDIKGRITCKHGKNLRRFNHWQVKF